MNYMLITIFLALLSCCNSVDNKNATFVPTKEWQEIKEGQSIQAGLHVRINLQTGKREAKLINEKDSTEDDNNSSSSNRNLALEYRADAKTKVKRVKKSFEELKKDYEEMRKSFKTDAELIEQLIHEYRNLSKPQEQTEAPTLTPQKKLKTQLQILENFEYLLHHYDNALIFIGNTGLEHVLLPLVVNETTTVLRIAAMRVLGSLTQNNPQAQIKVFERNFGSHLSQILMTSTHRDELASALFAFGSLLRKFPHAQQRIMSTSGIQALIGVLTKEDCELKTKARVVTLISDLVVEKRLVLNADDAEKDASAIAQYALLDFDEWLQTHGYCEALDTLLTTQFLSFIEQAEYMDYFITALENTKPLCRPLWTQSSQLRHALLTLKNRFMQSGDEYRGEIALAIGKFCDDLFEKRKTHDEF